MSTFQPYDPNNPAGQNNGNDLEPPPDGTYTGCELVDASAFSAKSGSDFVKLEWRTQDGHTWTVLQGFKSEAQTAVTWSEVGKLGIDPTDIASLEQLNQILTSHVGSYYDLGVKTNGQFKNTYINGPTGGRNPVVQAQTQIAQQHSEAPQQGDPDEAGQPIPF